MATALSGGVDQSLRDAFADWSKYVASV